MNEKVDIWAAGCILYFLCFKKPPFEGKLASIQGQYFVPYDHTYSQKLVDFLKYILVLDPNKRPSTDQLLEYITKFFSHIEYKQKVSTSYLKPTTRVHADLQEEFESQKNVPISLINQVKEENQSQVSPSFFDICKKAFKRITTNTEGIFFFTIKLFKFNNRLITFCNRRKWR